MKNQNQTNSTGKSKRSLKGKRGNQVGAPPKPFHLPSGQFTYAAAFAVNAKSCKLTIRKKVDVLVTNGELIELQPRKQTNGGVGRPKAVFIKAELFNTEKHVRLGQIPVTKTVKPKTTSKTKPKTTTKKTPKTVAVPMDSPVQTNTVPTPLNMTELDINRQLAMAADKEAWSNDTTPAPVGETNIVPMADAVPAAEIPVQTEQVLTEVAA